MFTNLNPLVNFYMPFIRKNNIKMLQYADDKHIGVYATNRATRRLLFSNKVIKKLLKEYPDVKLDYDKRTVLLEI